MRTIIFQAVKARLQWEQLLHHRVGFVFPSGPQLYIFPALYSCLISGDDSSRGPNPRTSPGRPTYIYLSIHIYIYKYIYIYIYTAPLVPEPPVPPTAGGPAPLLVGGFYLRADSSAAAHLRPAQSPLLLGPSEQMASFTDLLFKEDRRKWDNP